MKLMMRCLLYKMLMLNLTLGDEPEQLVKRVDSDIVVEEV